MTELWTNIALVLVFVVIGGAFAAAEIALVSLRESQVRNISQRGKRGERVARLAADPNRFLSAVQVGVTFAGFLSAAFGAATLAEQLVPVFTGWGLSEGLSATLALVGVTLVIAYFSLVLGELAPKRLALQRSEQVALLFAPAVDRLAVAAQPLIWLLSRSTDVVVRLAGGDPTAQRDVISEEELRELVAGHETLGDEERQIVEDVFTAGERQLREVMVPRTEVDFLEAKTPIFKAVEIAMTSPHSRYPVVDGSQDNVVGFVHVRDLFAPAVAGRSLRVQDIVRDIVYLPSTKQVLAALSEMRREGKHLAVVLDEYGGTFGIVTLEDLVEELVGDIRDEYDADEPPDARAVDGTMEVNGLLNLTDFEEETGIELPEGPYETVAGFVMSELGRLPSVGDSVLVGDWELVVTQLDARRIERIRVVPRAPTDESAGESPGQSPADPGSESGGHSTGEPDRGSAEASPRPRRDPHADVVSGLRVGAEGLDPAALDRATRAPSTEQAPSSTR